MDWSVEVVSFCSDRVLVGLGRDADADGLGSPSRLGPDCSILFDFGGGGLGFVI